MTDPQRIEITAESIEVNLPAPPTVNVNVAHDDGLDRTAQTELLLAHYNDSFQHLANHLKSRNRMFVYILVVVAAMAVDMSSPNQVQKLLLSWLMTTVGAKESQPEDNPGAAAPADAVLDQQIFDAQIVNNVIWFVLLCLVVAYFQKSIHVNRKYHYIESIEDRIREQAGAWLVYREGKAYRSPRGSLAEAELDADPPDQRPWVLAMIGRFYVFAVPSSLVIFSLVKIGIEFNGKYTIWRPGLAFSGAATTSVFLILSLIACVAAYLDWCIRRQ